MLGPLQSAPTSAGALKRLPECPFPLRHGSMRTGLAILVAASLCMASPARAQSGTQTDIVFTQEKKDEARQQLRRILSAYTLDPWIVTQEVRIEAGVDPHSHPILTLNTRYLDDDEMQLSIFLHEQAHWFVSRSVRPFPPEDDEEPQAVIKDLRALYPHPPSAADYGAFVHLLVGWIELDAMAELIGEQEARQLLKRKIEQVAEAPLSEADREYRWYNTRVLEDTEQIGAVVARHGLVITPERGLSVSGGRER